MSRNEMAVKQSILDNLKIDHDTYFTLKSSIFPGAKDESIAMAISYCRAAKLDILQKAVHLVPMPVKDENGRYVKDQYGKNVYRDVVMPGIAFFRIQAARTGEYAGIDKPKYGHIIKENIGGIEIEYPISCEVTVKRIVKGIVCDFTAEEYWKENFSATREGKPNAMWVKRTMGQLAKCSEAQALRKAFPELLGGLYTMEEMEGKHIVSDVLEQPKPANHGEFVSEDQIIYLTDKIAESKADEMGILKYCKIGCLDEMKQTDFLNVDRMLDAKIKKLEERTNVV